MKHLDNPKEIISLLRSVRKTMVALATGTTSTDGSSNLGGWCVLSSYVLFHMLKRRGYHPEVCRNHGHAFINLDGWYIDITVSQFNSASRLERGIRYPAIYCKKTPAKDSVHWIVDKTDKAEEIWGNLCEDWNQPLPLTNPVIRNLVENI